MSGTRAAGTNVVPMPSTAAPAPMAYPWPMPPGGFPAGCCPPGGMDALLQCYCDIQAATAFISKVVQDLAANDPAFQQSLVDAIVASGSNIPLIGVTNGTDAQPGQVGEWVHLRATPAIPQAPNTQVVSMGFLNAGDWDCWLYCTPTVPVTNISLQLTPPPPGFFGDMYTVTGNQVEEVQTITSTVVRALTTMPSAIILTVLSNYWGTGGTGPGNLELDFFARRVR